MFWILMVILVVGILILIFVAIYDIFDLAPKSNCTKLPYKQFIGYYLINPDRWDLYSNHVEYKVYDEKSNYLLNYHSYTYEIFTFSFVDMIKYHCFKHKIDTNKKKYLNSKRDSEAYRNLLTSVQKDIDKLRQQSEDELNEAMNTMKEVKERIG